MYAILDGQFLNIKSSEEILINKQELLLSDLKMYEDGQQVDMDACFNNKNFGMSLYFDGELKNYFLKEVTTRKEISDLVTLELKQIFFEFGYP